MRGSLYSFANASRLECELGQLGIRYHSMKSFAPSEETRRIQAEADKAEGTSKTSRQRLSLTFEEAYRTEALSEWGLQFAETLLGNSENPVLFCVERNPSACHRSLLATALAGVLKRRVIHLLP